MLAICALAIALAIVIAPPVGIAVAAVGGLAAVGVFAYQHNKVSQMKQMAIDIAKSPVSG